MKEIYKHRLVELVSWPHDHEVKIMEKDLHLLEDYEIPHYYVIKL